MHKRKYISSLNSVHDHTVIDVRFDTNRTKQYLSNWISFPISPKQLSKTSGLKLIKQKLTELIQEQHDSGIIVLICKDGGVISKSVWEILRLDFDTYIYRGGFRQLVKKVHQVLKSTYNLLRLAGPTGSGKTEILHELERSGIPCINLEVLAQHAGSVFGNIKNNVQPTQFEFEYQLAVSLKEKDAFWPIVVEDEQANLGQVGIPSTFWTQMQNATFIYIYMTEHARVKRLVDSYAEVNDQSIEVGILRLESKLGKTRTEELILALREKHYAEVAKALITYYDHTPGYLLSEPSKNDVVIKSDDVAEITNKIVDYVKEKARANPGH